MHLRPAMSHATALVILQICQHHSILGAVLREQCVVQGRVIQLAVRRLGRTLLAYEDVF